MSKLIAFLKGAIEECKEAMAELAPQNGDEALRSLSRLQGQHAACTLILEAIQRGDFGDD